jgi:hypothetical protein
MKDRLDAIKELERLINSAIVYEAKLYQKAGEIEDEDRKYQAKKFLLGIKALKLILNKVFDNLPKRNADKVFSQLSEDVRAHIRQLRHIEKEKLQ